MSDEACSKVMKLGPLKYQVYLNAILFYSNSRHFRNIKLLSFQEENEEMEGLLPYKKCGRVSWAYSRGWGGLWSLKVGWTVWQIPKSLQKARMDKSQVSMSELTKATSKHSLARGEHQSKYGIQWIAESGPSCQRPDDASYVLLGTCMTPEFPSTLVLFQ